MFGVAQLLVESDLICVMNLRHLPRREFSAFEALRPDCFAVADLLSGGFNLDPHSCNRKWKFFERFSATSSYRFKQFSLSDDLSQCLRNCDTGKVAPVAF